MAIYLKVVDEVKNGSCEGCWFEEGFRCDEINHYGEKYFDCDKNGKYVKKIAVPATPEEIERYKQKKFGKRLKKPSPDRNKNRILIHTGNDPEWLKKAFEKAPADRKATIIPQGEYKIEINKRPVEFKTK